MENEVMTLEELAAYLKVSLPTLRRQVDKENIPYQLVGVQKRFHKKAIDAWLGEKNNNAIVTQ